VAGLPISPAAAEAIQSDQQNMNPYANALKAYHAGNHSASFLIRRNDGFDAQVPVSAFFSDKTFPNLEQQALDLCHGRVLDIGAAAGRHSLALIRRGVSVTSLDIAPELEGLLRERGAQDVVISDILVFSGKRFETLLMLMNGIGMVGTLERLDNFLRHAHLLIAPGGQILCDSIDVSVTMDPIHVAYREQNLVFGKQPGQQKFTITYDNHEGAAFDWLHIDFLTFSKNCLKTGWKAELICEEADGHYLCRIQARH
jgi:2-polyprenyl-3-methyl-5-hydroxy-6-metoxy-1,4-benzoquinol methylase